MIADRYRVALLSDHAEVEVWLTPRLATTPAAWEAGEFSWAEANDFAAWARRTIRPRPPAHLRWTVVPVRVEAVTA